MTYIKRKKKIRHSVKEANLKRLHCEIPTLRTFWKRQDYEDSKKISGCRGWWGRRIFFFFLGPWDYSARDDSGGHRLLYICQHLQDVQHQEWTQDKLWTLGGYKVSAGSSIITNGSCAGDADHREGCACAKPRDLREISAQSTHFHCEPKTKSYFRKDSLLGFWMDCTKS